MKKLKYIVISVGVITLMVFTAWTTWLTAKLTQTNTPPSIPSPAPQVSATNTGAVYPTNTVPAPAPVFVTNMPLSLVSIIGTNSPAQVIKAKEFSENVLQRIQSLVEDENRTPAAVSNVANCVRYLADHYFGEKSSYLGLTIKSNLLVKKFAAGQAHARTSDPRMPNAVYSAFEKSLSVEVERLTSLQKQCRAVHDQVCPWCDKLRHLAEAIKFSTDNNAQAPEGLIRTELAKAADAVRLATADIGAIQISLAEDGH